MKRPGLTPLVLAATLFLAPWLHSEDAKPTAQALNLPPAVVSPASGPDGTKEAMKSLAGSGDGKLDEQAYAEMLKEQAGSRPEPKPAGPMGSEEYRQKMLEMFDQNHDGRLDESERAAARQYAAEHGGTTVAAGLVKRFDLDGDGKLNVEEVAALLSFLSARRQASAAAPNSDPKAEAERLNRVAAEVARRRELREQAAKAIGAKPESKP